MRPAMAPTGSPLSGGTGRSGGPALRLTGSSNARLTRSVLACAEITEKYGFLPTFVVSPRLAQREPAFLVEMKSAGADVALRVDRGAAQGPDVEAATTMEAATRLSITPGGVLGLRGPLTPDAARLAGAGVQYVSTRSFAWEVMDREQFTGAGPEAYAAVVRSRDCVDPLAEPGIPSMTGALVDVPTTMPDGESLLGLLGQPEGSAASVWLRILQRVHHLGDMMVIDMTADRMSSSPSALEPLLQKAGTYTPGVWLATMSEVAAWWSERESATIGVHDVGEGRYRIDTTGGDRLSLMLRGLEGTSPSAQWHRGYSRVSGPTTTVESSRRPVIGLPQRAPGWAQETLAQAGFVSERVDVPGACALYVDSDGAFQSHRALLTAIEGSDAPVVRLGLWPDGAACALCVTARLSSGGFWDGMLRRFKRRR